MNAGGATKSVPESYNGKCSLSYWKTMPMARNTGVIFKL